MKHADYETFNGFPIAYTSHDILIGEKKVNRKKFINEEFTQTVDENLNYVIRIDGKECKMISMWEIIKTNKAKPPITLKRKKHETIVYIEGEEYMRLY